MVKRSAARWTTRPRGPRSNDRRPGTELAISDCEATTGPEIVPRNSGPDAEINRTSAGTTRQNCRGSVMEPAAAEQQGRPGSCRVSPPPPVASSDLGRALRLGRRTRSPAPIAAAEIGRPRKKAGSLSCELPRSWTKAIEDLTPPKKFVAFAVQLPRTPFEGPDLMRNRNRTGLIGLFQGLRRGNPGKEMGKPLSANPAFLLTASRPNRRHGSCDHPRPDERQDAERGLAGRGSRRLATPLGQKFCGWPRTPGGRRFP